MILLDTDVVSGLRRPDRAHPNLLRWASRTAAQNHYISAITVREIETGVLLVERRDPAQGEVLRTWLQQAVLVRFDARILPFDLAAARVCAQLHVPDRRPERDAMIAATALVHGMPVATRNTADFAPTGVPLINPWEGET